MNNKHKKTTRTKVRVCVYVCINIKRHGLYLQFRREQPQLNRIESTLLVTNKSTITQQKRNKIDRSNPNRVVLLEEEKKHTNNNKNKLLYNKT